MVQNLLRIILFDGDVMLLHKVPDSGTRTGLLAEVQPDFPEVHCVFLSVLRTFYHIYWISLFLYIINESKSVCLCKSDLFILNSTRFHRSSSKIKF